MKDKIENLLKNGTAGDIEIAIYLLITHLSTGDAHSILRNMYTKIPHWITFKVGNVRYKSWGSYRGGHQFYITNLSSKELRKIGLKNISK